MTDNTKAPAAPAVTNRFAHLNQCSAEDWDRVQVILKRVQERSSRAEHIALSRPRPVGSLGRAPSPRFASVKQVADFILTAGRGPRR